MTTGPRRRGQRHRVLASLAVITALAAGCSSASTGDAPAGAGTPAVPGVSLATSMETSAGSWAVVPMGHFDQPLNTFWQLFFRPSGASRWSDDAKALAVATNGGIILANDNDRSLAIGIRPANLLEYSPLLVTPDGGSSVTPAAPVAALARQPDALAVSSPQWLALTANGGGEVQQDDSGSTSWHPLTTVKTLDQSVAGRSCGLVSMTAVAVASGGALVGADCSRTGKVGVFADQGSWRLVGPSLPSALDGGTVAVLGLQETEDGVCAVLEVSEGHDASLISAWTTDGGASWSLSPILQLGRRKVLSIGPDGPTGLFVLASSTGDADLGEVLTGPKGSWRGLPPVPDTTQTLVCGANGSVDALAVSDTVFTDWKLTAGAAGWTKAQVIKVPIEFGSSS